jgi:predicted O-methyltransferase YrrM
VISSRESARAPKGSETHSARVDAFSEGWKVHFPSVLARLSDIDAFLKLSARFAHIEGFLEPIEAYALYLLAADGPGVGSIVELGSYLGRSTAFLAAGSLEARREKVIAVDHFKGSAEHQAGQIHESEVLKQDGTLLERFQTNLRRAGVMDHVSPLVAPTTVGARQWNGLVRLLFIDADHSFAAVKADFEAWTRHVIPGGLVALHDIGKWPEVTEYYQSILANDTDFRQILGVASLRILEKVR